MKRFVVRNYGVTRQLPYKDQQIFIANDSAIETDDEEMAVALKENEAIHVTDRGPEASELSLPITEKPKEPEESERSEEISYEDMTVKELQVLAKDRQIKTSGLNKAELIEALEDYNKEPVEEIAELTTA